MMSPVLQYLDENLMVAASYDKLSVIESCYRAIDEDAADYLVVDMAASYTNSMLLEILDNIKEGLYHIYQRIMSALNNYVLNSANLIDKYRNLVIDRYIKLQEPIVFKTYEYPKLKDPNYPALLKSSVSVERDVLEFQDKIISDNLTPSQVSSRVDDMIRQFGRDVLDGTIRPMELKKSVQDLVRKTVQGREVTRKLTQSDLNEFIDEIRKHKETKDELNRTKTNMLTDYNNLKEMCKASMRRKEAESVGLKSLKSPEAQALQIADYNRFADINLAMNRLLNAYITIYSEAFNTRLKVINEKIEANRNIINELMIRTGVFAMINTKHPDKRRKPYVYDSTIKT